LGVRYRIVSRELALLNDIPEGAFVLEVVEGSPADKAGVTVEDIITKIDNNSISAESELAKVISRKKVGEEVILSIWRGGKELSLSVTLGTNLEE
jgi:S1-C subfamily serine protease